MRSCKYIFVFLLFVSALFSSETPNCLNFEDGNDYVYIDDGPLRFTSRFTIECWFNIHEFTDSSSLIDFSSTGLSDEILSRNVHFNLNGIYPNPFNPQVTISFNVITEPDINLSIYSSSGDLVDIIGDKKYQSGSHILYWNPKGLSTGIYFLKINSKNQSDTYKLLYMK